jgi:hypothetical protein
MCLRAKGQVAVLRLARGFSCSFVSGFTQGPQFQRSMVLAGLGV